MQIIKNFLPEEEFNNLKNILTGGEFPYYFQDSVATFEDIKHFYFVHELYFKNVPQSRYFNLILPLLEKLNMLALVRVKVNCFPRTEKLIKYGKHTDQTFSLNGAIFSLNTCNGGTLVEDKFIPSIANQLLLFDSGIPHQSTNCTDEKCRFNINVNYF